MKNYEQVIEQMTPELYETLKQSLELSKWPNGEKLSQSQKETCMQAVLAYEIKHLPESERTGYVVKGKIRTENGIKEQPVNLIDILDLG